MWTVPVHAMKAYNIISVTCPSELIHFTM